MKPPIRHHLWARLCRLLLASEGVSRWIGEDSEARLAVRRGTCGSEGEKVLFGSVRVGYPYVEVQLLRLGGIGPHWRSPLAPHPLKGQLPLARLRPDDDQSSVSSLIVMPST